MRVNRLHRSLVEKTMREAGLHRSQHLMLIYLKNCKEAPSQKEIAASFDVTPAAVAMAAMVSISALSPLNSSAASGQTLLPAPLFLHP